MCACPTARAFIMRTCPNNKSCDLWLVERSLVATTRAPHFIFLLGAGWLCDSAA